MSKIQRLNKQKINKGISLNNKEKKLEKEKNLRQEKKDMKVLLSLKNKRQRFRLYDRDSKVVSPFEIDDYNYEQENKKYNDQYIFRKDSKFYYIHDIDESIKCKKDFLNFDHEHEIYRINGQFIKLCFKLIKNDYQVVMSMSVEDEDFMKSILENPDPKIMINVLKKLLIDHIEYIENREQLIRDEMEWYSL